MLNAVELPPDQVRRAADAIREFHARTHAGLSSIEMREFANTCGRIQEHLQSLPLIFERVQDTVRQFQEEDRAFQDAHASGSGPLDAEAFARMQRVITLKSYAELDIEAVFGYGTLLLDSWSNAIRIGLRLPRSAQSSNDQFETLLNLLQGRTCPPALAPLLQVPHQGRAAYLCVAVRAYRNKFVQHNERPWTRGVTYHPTEAFIALARYLPDELLPPVAECRKDFEDMVKEFKLDAYAPTNLRDAVTLLLEISVLTTTQAQRQTIVSYLGKYGAMSPAYHRACQRLVEFFADATAALTPAAVP